MHDLTPEQIQELHQDLLALHDELETLLALSEESARPVDLDQPIGRISRIDAIQQQSMAQANRHGHTIRLAQVRAALAALQDDEYGYCKSCDEPIGYPRLSVRPEAAFCLRCQEQRESRR